MENAVSLTKYLHQVKPREESYVNHVDRIQGLLFEEWSKANVAISLKKYPQRREHFLKKYKNEEEFILKTSPDPVKFVYDKGVYDKIESEDFKVIFKDSSGNTYKFNDIAKTAEFGGKGAGAGTAKEDAELKSLQNQIISEIEKSSKATVTIDVNGTKHEITAAVTTPGTPKSDFHLLDTEGNEVVWISHKNGRSANDHQQWGGMSQKREPDIFNHRETKSFISDLKKEFPDGLPNTITLYRKIKDKSLQKKAVYGNKSGKELGKQNVSIVVQGPIKLNGGKLTANHVLYNGEDITGGYEPVLMAMYKGPDRNDAGVKKTRLSIYPIEGRKTIEPEFIKVNFKKVKLAIKNKSRKK
tara:strand:- start:51 stop:1118 length:1068 start_codon:yes stop_codon:yes gene_type:complete